MSEQEKLKGKEEYIQNITNEIRNLLKNAKKKDDLDFIIKRFKIKCKKNKKPVSPITLHLRMDVKRKIIKMKMEEPEDIFDYDHWCASDKNKKK